MHPRGLASLAFALAGVACFAYAEVRLENAWLRPAYAGQPEAAVYVDIHSTEALRLVGASTTAASEAKLVLVDPPDPDPSSRKVVNAIPVAANAQTRLAYLGSHIRLQGIREALKPGDAIRLELTFADAKGLRQTVGTEARVRGLVPRRAPEDTPTAVERREARK